VNLVNGFTVVTPQPTVTNVTANSVTYGVTSNQQVTIYGTNFVLGSTITVGSLSGTTVSGSQATAGVPYVYVTSGQLKLWWPNTSLAPGAYTVTVTNPTAAGGLSASLSNGFTVVAPQPTISVVTASSVTYGVTASSQVTISGTNFVLGSTITVGSLSGATVSGSNATAGVPYVLISSGQVRFWWPNTALAPGAYTVTVTNPTAAGGLSASLSNGFTVVAPQPTITSVTMSPVTYGVTTSRSITIFGTNFVLGSTITVGSLSGTTVSGSNATVSVPYVFATSGQVKFWWPNTSLPVDLYDVTVTNPASAGGLSTTLTDGFDVQ
jgi:CTP:molybdopterin cytidylyltransferase MocA